MATQLATTNDNPQPGRKVAVQAGAKLAAFIPQTLEEAWRLAGALAASGMTPKSYGADQNKIMVGMMAGAEVGLTPMAALQSIAVIGNNPSLWGDGALGLIQASGLLEDMEEADDGTTATCTMKRKGRTTPITRSFSMEDAKRAGLSGKAGPWTQYPARMRQMRARAFAMRDGFADVLRGLHIAEEARDYAPMQDGGALAAQPLTGQALLEQARPDETQVEQTEVAGETIQADEATNRAELDAALAEIAEAETAVDVNSRVSRWKADLPHHADELASAGIERIAALGGAAQ
jgi:hypothetical protein